MDSPFAAFRSRLVPAVLTAAGVGLIAAGLLTYSAPVEAGPGPSDPPTSASPTISDASPLPTLPPLGSPSPTLAPSAPADRVATRVRIPALRIDLPVIRPVGGPDTYPQCNVAMFIQELHQPGQGAATYLYAHARQGMFLPLLTVSKQNGGKAMIGMLVEVYTSDDQLFVYYISEVLRHQRNLTAAQDATSEQLWLQTSEGPAGTVGKLQILALPLTTGPTDHAAAHPVAHPLNCG